MASSFASTLLLVNLGSLDRLGRTKERGRYEERVQVLFTQSLKRPLIITWITLNSKSTDIIVWMSNSSPNAHLVIS